MFARVASITAMTALVACQQATPTTHATPEQLSASATARRAIPSDYNRVSESDVCDPAIRNPYLIAECHEKLVSQGKSPALLDLDVQRQLACEQYYRAIGVMP